MCGISGYLLLSSINKTTLGDIAEFKAWFIAQQQCIALRGQDAFGMATLPNASHTTKRATVFKTTNSKEFFNRLANDSFTSGEMYINYRGIPSTEYFGGSLTDEQIQPFFSSSGHSLVIHNGQLANDKDMYKKHGIKNITSLPDGDIDSYAFLNVDLKELKGSWATIIRQNKTLVLSRTYLGLEVCVFTATNGTQWLVFGSEFFKKGNPSLRFIPFPPFSTVSLDLMTVGNGDLDILWYNFACAQTIDYDKQDKQRAVVVCSGGLDSTVVATIACHQCEVVHLIHFQYGCKAEHQELRAVKAIVHKLKSRFPDKEIKLEVISLDFLKQLGGSTLIDKDKDVTKGELGAEISTEYVPARNTVMMSLAAAYCDRHQMK